MTHLKELSEQETGCDWLRCRTSGVRENDTPDSSEIGHVTRGVLGIVDKIIFILVPAPHIHTWKKVLNKVRELERVKPDKVAWGQ